MLLPFASMGHVFSKRGRVVLPWSRIIRFDLFRNNYSHASIPFNSLKFLPFYSLILHPGGCLFVPPTVIRIYFFFFFHFWKYISIYFLTGTVYRLLIYSWNALRWVDYRDWNQKLVRRNISIYQAINNFNPALDPFYFCYCTLFPHPYPSQTLIAYNSINKFPIFFTDSHVSIDL